MNRGNVLTARKCRKTISKEFLVFSANILHLWFFLLPWNMWSSLPTDVYFYYTCIQFLKSTVSHASEWDRCERSPNKLFKMRLKGIVVLQTSNTHFCHGVMRMLLGWMEIHCTLEVVVNLNHIQCQITKANSNSWYMQQRCQFSQL